MFLTFYVEYYKKAHFSLSQKNILDTIKALSFFIITIFAKTKIMSHIQNTSTDYFQIDELLTEEHKIIRSSVRDWVNRAVKPIIESYAEKANFRFIFSKSLAN